jgi:hypothetical protein
VIKLSVTDIAYAGRALVPASKSFITASEKSVVESVAPGAASPTSANKHAIDYLLGKTGPAPDSSEFAKFRMLALGNSTAMGDDVVISIEFSPAGPSGPPAQVGRLTETYSVLAHTVGDCTLTTATMPVVSGLGDPKTGVKAAGAGFAWTQSKMQTDFSVGQIWYFYPRTTSWWTGGLTAGAGVSALSGNPRVWLGAAGSYGRVGKVVFGGGLALGMVSQIGNHEAAPISASATASTVRVWHLSWYAGIGCNFF